MTRDVRWGQPPRRRIRGWREAVLLNNVCMHVRNGVVDMASEAPEAPGVSRFVRDFLSQRPKNLGQRRSHSWDVGGDMRLLEMPRAGKTYLRVLFGVLLTLAAWSL
jgi:hypothetical protein